MLRDLERSYIEIASKLRAKIRFKLAERYVSKGPTQIEVNYYNKWVHDTGS